MDLLQDQIGPSEADSADADVEVELDLEEPRQQPGNDPAQQSKFKFKCRNESSTHQDVTMNPKKRTSRRVPNATILKIRPDSRLNSLHYRPTPPSAHSICTVRPVRGQINAVCRVFRPENGRGRRIRSCLSPNWRPRPPQRV